MGVSDHHTALSLSAPAECHRGLCSAPFCSTCTLGKYPMLLDKLCLCSLQMTLVSLAANRLSLKVSAILFASASAIANWLNDRGLILNASKSQVISISGNLPETHTPLSVNCNGTLLPLVESARYLGVTFDSNMSWDDHVTRCANRVSRKIGVLWRMRRCLST